MQVVLGVRGQIMEHENRFCPTIEINDEKLSPLRASLERVQDGGPNIPTLDTLA